MTDDIDEVECVPLTKADEQEVVKKAPSKPITKELWVRAPVDLPAGYEFVVEHEGADRLVRVASNGAKSGFRFKPEIVADVDDSDYHPIVGAWKVDLCGWIDIFGSTECLVSYCCMPLTLGHVQERLQIGICGGERGWSPFLFWQIITGALICFRFLSNVEEPGAEVVMILLLDAVVVVGIALTRQRLRQRYAIPGHVLMDGALSTVCACCTVMQMAAHTRPSSEARRTTMCQPNGLQPTCTRPISQIGRMQRQFVAEQV